MRSASAFFLWTALYWAVNGAGMMLFANGFDCLAGTVRDCEPIDITLFQGYFLLCVVIIGMMIPAGPAGAGTTQAALLIGLGVFLPESVVKSSGLAFAIVLWVVQVVQQILFGLFFLVRSHRSFSEIAGKLGEAQSESDKQLVPTPEIGSGT